MKEIKFRYVCVNKHSREISFEYFTDDVLRSMKISSWILSENCEVFDKQIFTGLVDKNGKGIYEGDCIVIDEKEYSVFYDIEKVCFILHDDESFQNRFFGDIDTSNLLITGNIFNIK